MKIILTTIAGMLCFASFAMDAVASDTVPRNVEVSARSELTVPPDEVLLSFTIDVHHQHLLTAKHRNDEITKAAMAIPPAVGIPAVDVKIIELDVRPETTRDGGFLHYSFSRTIRFRITDFAHLEPVISSLFEAGVTRVHRLQYRVRDQRKHQQDARRLAVEYAREKADHIAELTGLKLGKPLEIQTDVESGWDIGGFGGMASLSDNPTADKLVIQQPNKPSNSLRLVSLAQTKAASEETTANPKATGILFAPGEIEINATVTIKYELLDTSK